MLTNTIRIAKEEERIPEPASAETHHTTADDPVAETDGCVAVQGLLQLHTCSQCKAG